MIQVNVKMNDPGTQQVITLASATYEYGQVDHFRLMETFPEVAGFTSFFVEISTDDQVFRRPICGIDFAEKFGRPLDAFIDLGRKREVMNQHHGALRVDAVREAARYQHQ